MNAVTTPQKPSVLTREEVIAQWELFDGRSKKQAGRKNLFHCFFGHLALTLKVPFERWGGDA